MAVFSSMLLPRLESETAKPELFRSDLRKKSEFLEPLLC